MSENSSAAPEEVLTVDEAARILRVSTDGLYRMLARGEIPARRIGRLWRISRACLLEWLRSAPTREALPRPYHPAAATAPTTRRPAEPPKSRPPAAPPLSALERLHAAAAKGRFYLQMEIRMPGVLTMTEAGRRCGLPGHAIRRLIDAKEIPAAQFGRVVCIPEAEFLRWLREPMPGIDPSLKRSAKGYPPRGHAITMLVAEARRGAHAKALRIAPATATMRHGPRGT